MKYLFSLLVAGWVVSASQADHCNQIVQSVQVIATPITAVPVVQSVVVPVYSAVYQPPAESQSQSNEEILREILTELKAMRQELESLKTPRLAMEDDRFKIVKQSCSSCHSTQQADKLGGGFTLFDARGAILSLTESDRKRIVSRVSKNSMPPPEKKLSPADKQAILNAFTSK